VVVLLLVVLLLDLDWNFCLESRVPVGRENYDDDVSDYTVESTLASSLFDCVAPSHRAST
jgi:hypothetical protein